MSDTVRDVVASSRRLVREERFDLLVHAAAQLPDSIVVRIWGDGPARSELEILAQAYGIADRVLIHPGVPKEVHGRLVFPSPLNAVTAPLRDSESGPPLRMCLGETNAAMPGAVRTFAELIDALTEPDDPPASLRPEGDEILAGSRVAVITNVPIHYRIRLFSEVAARVSRAGGVLKVFFLARTSGDRPWMGSLRSCEFDHEVLRSLAIPLRPRPPHMPVDLDARLRSFGPTIVLCAGFSPLVAARAAAWAGKAGATFGLWSGEIPSRRSAKSRARSAQRRLLVRRAAFAISYGYLSGEYLRGLSPSLQVVYGRNASEVSGLRAGPVGGRGTVRLLTVADLATFGKGVDVLIDALRLAPGLDCRLRVVGGGRLLVELQRRAQGDPRVEFLGALSPDRTKSVYSESDVYLFPTRSDVFGLALQEAMASGLAVAVSSNPGAVADLCVPGRNCIVVDGHRPELWAEAIRTLVVDRNLRRSLASNARRTIESRWTIEHSADAFVAGLRLAALLKERSSLRGCGSGILV